MSGRPRNESRVATLTNTTKRTRLQEAARRRPATGITPVSATRRAMILYCFGSGFLKGPRFLLPLAPHCRVQPDMALWKSGLEMWKAAAAAPPRTVLYKLVPSPVTVSRVRSLAIPALVSGPSLLRLSDITLRPRLNCRPRAIRFLRGC